jgi:energy-coupling factor transport system permease protein
MRRPAHHPPRLLHPVAWWGWATCLAFAASRTTNPLLLALLLAVAGYVVAARRQATPWSRSFVVFLRLALVALVIRVLLFALLAPAGGTHVLLRLPEVPLPHWLAGLRLGGPIGAEGLLAAAYDGLRLGVVLVCIGAANSLTSPRRMLKSLPSALYEVGVALTVAVAFVPQAVAAVGRVHQARRIRGRRDRGLRALRGIALPVLEGALERSVDLAAAMEARGFGRRGDSPPATRRLTSTLTLSGLTLVLASTYGLLDSSAPTVLGLPMLLGGAALAGSGFVVGARRGGRSRYRPDPWRAPEWFTVGCGVAAAAAFVTGVHDGDGSVLAPLAAPDVPAAALVAALVALLPAWLTPAVPRPRSARAPQPGSATGAAAAA